MITSIPGLRESSVSVLQHRGIGNEGGSTQVVIECSPFVFWHSALCGIDIVALFWVRRWCNAWRCAAGCVKECAWIIVHMTVYRLALGERDRGRCRETVKGSEIDVCSRCFFRFSVSFFCPARTAQRPHFSKCSYIRIARHSRQTFSPMISRLLHLCPVDHDDINPHTLFVNEYRVNAL